jgi:hypothetical protein
MCRELPPLPEPEPELVLREREQEAPLTRALRYLCVSGWDEGEESRPTESSRSRASSEPL